jgi:hypothetical protein
MAEAGGIGASGVYFHRQVSSPEFSGNGFDVVLSTAREVAVRWEPVVIRTRQTYVHSRETQRLCIVQEAEDIVAGLVEVMQPEAVAVKS